MRIGRVACAALLLRNVAAGLRVQQAAAGLSRRSLMAGSMIAATLGSQPAGASPGGRIAEADVGMTFKRVELTDKLFAQDWPAEYPFPPSAFARQDESDDGDFYASPRFVYHIDEGAVRSLTDYYKATIKDGSAILDICSSWVSHYPDDFPKRMGRISGTGMNANELGANTQLSDFKPRNLNIEAKLPYDDASFDVVTCVVSVDYLTKPLEVFAEARRVLKPGGRFILSQSNRFFPTKAIRVCAAARDGKARGAAWALMRAPEPVPSAAPPFAPPRQMWLNMSDLQHCLVIGAYFHYAGGWAKPRAFDISPSGKGTNDPMFIVEATKL